MTEINPFEAPAATPQLERLPSPDDVAWRDLSTLVAVDGCELPGGCVLCNISDGGQPRTVELRWSPDHGAAGFLLWISLVGWPILLAWDFATQKRAKLRYRICGWHDWQTWQSPRYLFAAAWGIMIIGGFISMITSARNIDAILAIVIICTTSVSAIAFVVRSKFLRLRKIRDGKLWITGVSDGYLQTLPEWPKPSPPSPVWRQLGRFIRWITSRGSVTRR